MKNKQDEEQEVDTSEAIKDATKYEVGPKGQLELDGFNTPLSSACKEFIALVEDEKVTQAKRETVKERIIRIKKDKKIRTVSVAGETLQFQPGHKTPDKIKFIPSTN